MNQQVNDSAYLKSPILTRVYHIDMTTHCLVPHTNWIEL